MHSELKRSPNTFRQALKGRVLMFAGSDGRPATKDQRGLVASIAHGQGWSVRWKDGIVGNPYIANDEVFVQPGDMVMCFLQEPDTLNIHFPPARSAAGQDIMLVNLVSKKVEDPGLPQLVPAPGDRIGGGEVDEVVSINEETLFGVFVLGSDGNGHWSGTSALGGNLFLFPAP